MQQRAFDSTVAQQQAQVDYIASAAGTGTSSTEELEKLASLHEKGVISDDEFADQKQKLLTS